MNINPFKLLNINRDAVATNRGFYFQYLSLLKIWVNNFINKTDKDLFSEVCDDIMEIGDRVIFTQLKCYTGLFSLTSAEVKTALLNYFVLYLDRLEGDQPALFVFETNTGIAPRDHLLQTWKANGLANSPDLHRECTNVVRKILLMEIKKIRDRKLARVSIKTESKDAVKEQFQTMLEAITEEQVGTFVGLVQWKFGETSPDAAIARLTQETLKALAHPDFQGRPPRMLFEVLLSEIYRVSQNSARDQRMLNTALIRRLLESRDEELSGYIDNRLLRIMDFRFTELFQSITDVKQIQEEQIAVQQKQQVLIDQLFESVDHVLANKPLERFITPIPPLANLELIERTSVLSNLKSLLSTKRHVAIQGPGGMGKSTLAKQFVHHADQDYEHLIWINIDTNILSAIVTNPHLLLALPQSIMERATDEHRFAAITGYLLTVPGKNLLVLNDYKGEHDKLDQLKALPNWDILLTTRMVIPHIRSFPVGKLSLTDAKKLFCRFMPGFDEPDELVFIKFLSLIDHNILMIELVAKAIFNSLDLKLETVVNLYESQKLDDDELDIEIDVAERAGSVKLFEYLKKTFNLDGLERINRFVCLFLALLPAEETLLSELIEWGGKAYEQSNKKIFVNACIRLHALGLIYREGNQVRMNRLLQEAIIYQERSSDVPFMSMMFQFVFLNARLQEGIAGNPQTALRFLKYAESILDSIKEPFREKNRQPLLAIENEVLMIWTWFKPDKEMKVRWQDLATRAELHLEAEDPLLSIIASNCGMAYHKIDELDMAQHYYEKAISGMRPIEAKVLPLLLTALGNLSLLFINKGDFQNFRPIFNEAVALRAKYKLWHDKTVPVHAYILAMANLKAENLNPAIELFHIAIDSHKELAVEEQDNTLLAGYLANLSMAYFFSGNVEKANSSINETVTILSRITVGDEKQWIQSADVILNLAQETLDEDSWQRLKDDLDLAYSKHKAQSIQTSKNNR